jgi:hypothetical protein
MDSAMAFRRKGFGSSFQTFRKPLMASSKSSTLKNEPRRTRFEFSSANQRLAGFDQLERVGLESVEKPGKLLCR